MKTPTALTASAGEHYVSYLLSVRGYIAALTRGGSPSVDILASSIDGKKTIGIQVKTSRWAYRDRKRNKEESHWEFDVGPKAIGKSDNSFVYAFVNLWGDKPEQQVRPLVFLVPPAVVAAALGSGHSRNMFWIYLTDREKYEIGIEGQNWSLIEEKLGKSS